MKCCEIDYIDKGTEELFIHFDSMLKKPFKNLPWSWACVSYKNYDCSFDIEEVIKKIISLSGRYKKILFHGGCKDACYASYAARKVKDLLGKKVGVVMSPAPMDFVSSDKEELLRNTPALRDYLKNSYFMMKYEVLDMEKTLSGGEIKIWCVCGKNSRIDYDVKVARRLEKYGAEVLEISMNEEMNYEEVHRGAFSYFKEKEKAFRYLQDRMESL